MASLEIDDAEDDANVAAESSAKRGKKRTRSRESSSAEEEGKKNEKTGKDADKNDLCHMCKKHADLTRTFYRCPKAHEYRTKGIYCSDCLTRIKKPLNTCLICSGECCCIEKQDGTPSEFCRNRDKHKHCKRRQKIDRMRLRDKEDKEEREAKRVKLTEDTTNTNNLNLLAAATVAYEAGKKASGIETSIQEVSAVTGLAIPPNALRSTNSPTPMDIAVAAATGRPLIVGKPFTTLRQSLPGSAEPPPSAHLHHAPAAVHIPHGAVAGMSPVSPMAGVVPTGYAVTSTGAVVPITQVISPPTTTTMTTSAAAAAAAAAAPLPPAGPIRREVRTEGWMEAKLEEKLFLHFGRSEAEEWNDARFFDDGVHVSAARFLSENPDAMKIHRTPKLVIRDFFFKFKHVDDPLNPWYSETRDTLERLREIYAREPHLPAYTETMTSSDMVVIPPDHPLRPTGTYVVVEPSCMKMMIGVVSPTAAAQAIDLIQKREMQVIDPILHKVLRVSRPATEIALRMNDAWRWFTRQFPQWTPRAAQMPGPFVYFTVTGAIEKGEIDATGHFAEPDKEAVAAEAVFRWTPGRPFKQGVDAMRHVESLVNVTFPNLQRVWVLLAAAHFVGPSETRDVSVKSLCTKNLRSIWTTKIYSTCHFNAVNVLATNGDVFIVEFERVLTPPPAEKILSE